MYALEKQERCSDVWRRCAVCCSREPVEKILAGLKDGQNGDWYMFPLRYSRTWNKPTPRKNARRW